MEKILFDCSSHLGQFCTTDEDVRRGCKNTQASFSPRGKFSRMGMWTDLENGRTDRTVWNLPPEIQDHYYPIMDRFFSLTNVQQEPVSDREVEWVLQLRNQFPLLSPYSRHTCAAAIMQGATDIHTLIQELLTNDVSDFMASCGVIVTKPMAKEEMEYPDALLEQRYQSALKAFRACNLDLPYALADARKVSL